MLDLVEDIKITVQSQTQIDRIWLNTGTCAIAQAENYVPNSFLPQLDWRPAIATELTKLIAPPNYWESGRQVAIVQIPESLVAPLRQDQDADPQAMAAYVQQTYGMSDREIKLLGMHCTPPGRITTTVDTHRYLPKKPHVGLHLDSWENAPLRRRSQSDNRICINIGTETRYFLLINLSLLKIFELLGLSIATDLSRHYRGTRLPAEFMQRFPNYPVIKLALAPNEAYIAPTENMIHDASTLDKQALDRSLTFLGQFSLYFSQFQPELLLSC